MWRKVSGPSSTDLRWLPPNAYASGIVVPFNPDPFPPGLEPGESHGVVFVEVLRCTGIIEAVTEAQDPARFGPIEVCGKARKRVARLVRGKKKAHGTGQPIGLSQVEVRHYEDPPIRPVESA